MSDFAGPPLDTEPGLGALTLGGLLSETVALHGDRPAIAYRPPGEPPVHWTYDELDHRANAVARALLATGCGKGARVGILMGNRPEWVAAAFGIARAGGVIVAVNTFLEPPELEYVLAHADVSLLLTQARLAGHAYVDDLTRLAPAIASAPGPGGARSPQLPHLRRVVCTGLDEPFGAVESWDAFIRHGDDVPPELVGATAASVAPADDALIVYTSGTTALPKGILHPHRAPAIQSWRFAQQLRLTRDIRTWSAFPFFWSAGFVMIMGATLAAGGCLVLADRFEPGEALALMEAERVTSPHAWPHQLAAMEDHPSWPTVDLSSIRFTEAFTSFSRHPSVRAPEVWSPRAAFGLTETCTIISSAPVDTPVEPGEPNSGPILPGIVLRILDRETGAPLGVGEIGEITVKGATMMRGYVKVEPEACFDADGFFRTGDAGFVDDHNRLYWTGRMTDMIKTGGANVSPVEIETALLHHPLLKAAVAIGVPHETLGEMVVVCAVGHDGADVDEENVREFLRGRIAHYKIPRRVVFFSEDELDTTANAKIRVDELRKLVAPRLTPAV